ncbi:MAG: pyridoxamine 5'-phosphate oxidase [Prochloraceae cyanobacterium]|nr:pyridoxamine 5'-phosphate oxidase [Prochloraceae cyanobacterium]
MNKQRPKVMVAGATGYIGGGVLQVLHQKGFWIRALCREKSRLVNPNWYNDIMDISALRTEYIQATLSRQELNLDPFKQFEQWFQQAIEANLPEPNAMILATASATGSPSTRAVLLKYFDRSGFVFFSNYESKKAQQIQENPRVSLLFLWLGLQRQVQILGTADKISTASSLKYFATRPRGSQLGAWSSMQSTIISSRQILEMKFEEIKRKFLNCQVPLPSFWGGYKVVPKSFEFWQGRPHRLHDRFLYSRCEDGFWKIERLSP